MFKNIFTFIFGLLVGSFLNVCIHRLPVGESVFRPRRSYCPHCKKTIRWYDNIPLVSLLLLGRKCRFCRAPISWRYPLVELLTAIVFLVFYRTYGVSFDCFYYTLMTCGLIVATFVDIPYQIIPDEVSVGGIAAGLLLNVARGMHLHPLSFESKPLIASLIGACMGGGIIFLMGFTFDLVYFRILKKPPIQGETSSMGVGDVKLLAMIGAFLGWQNAVITFFVAPFLGIVVGLFNLIVKKNHTIPYGPFLALAALISLFWGQLIKTFFFGG